MTDQRTLKKLVRERMARTGERYTTAHRHVVAQAAEQAAARVAGLRGEGAAPVPEHGPSHLARLLLADAGVPVSEPLACGLGGGIGFLYAVFEYRGVPTPLLTIVAQHHPQPWLDAVAQHLGLTLTSVTSSRTTPALAKLDAVLDAGRPAQVVVAAGHLPWRDPAGPAEAADPCAVVVTGRDGATYVVDDGDGERRPLAADVLGAAWAAHRKGRFALTTVEPPAHAPDLAAGVRAAVVTTHAHLTGPVLGHSFDANLGLSGMRRLAADLADTRTARGWPRRFGEPAALASGAARLAECLTSAYTAPGGTRPLYARFLEEGADLTGLDLVPAARTAADAGRGWAEVADVAGAVQPTDDPAAVLPLLADVVGAVVPVEERLAAQLGEALGTG